MSKRPLDEITSELSELTTKHVGRFARHVKSDGLYLVNGFVFNACTDQVDVIYLPWPQLTPRFSRNWDEFCDGRFEMKGDAS